MKFFLNGLFYAKQLNLNDKVPECAGSFCLNLKLTQFIFTFFRTFPETRSLLVCLLEPSHQKMSLVADNYCGERRVKRCHHGFFNNKLTVTSASCSLWFQRRIILISLSFGVRVTKELWLE